MTFIPTAEQQSIIDADLVDQRVIACAGSGKTATAVRRLFEIRRKIGAARGYVALLSYSNIAVETFRKEYRTLAAKMPETSNRILISTVDSFVTSQIVLPHASKFMGCDRQPFLVHGGEPFLKAFKVFNGTHNIDIEKLRVSIDDNSKFVFTDASLSGARSVIQSEDAIKAINKLAKTGAYTHDLGRYWAFTTILQMERLLEILVCRYPYILVDEAQDVGKLHGILLSMLKQAGSKLSLIGDPNQSIYEFADADGSFLRDFELGRGGKEFPITENRRSVSTIVTLANRLSSTLSTAVREAPTRKHGAYLIRYKRDELKQLLTTFSGILVTHGYSEVDATVLCRGTPLKQELTGGANEIGQGATEKFACGAICRDRRGDIAIAFEFTLDGIFKILDNVPGTLKRDILNSSKEPIPRTMRSLIWSFLKNSTSGLPTSNLNASSEWLPRLKKHLPVLLSDIEKNCKISALKSWKHNVTAAKLSEGPLWNGDLLDEKSLKFPIKTVHGAKGESIDAVLYVAKTKDISYLLNGPSTEEGRIGYVALTRARDLFLMAIPDKTTKPTISALLEKGFNLW